MNKEESDSGRRETKRKKVVCVWGSVLLLFSEKAVASLIVLFVYY